MIDVSAIFAAPPPHRIPGGDDGVFKTDAADLSPFDADGVRPVEYGMAGDVGVVSPEMSGFYS